MGKSVVFIVLSFSFFPVFAKFNRPDPKRDWDSKKPHTLNLYQYTQNDPINNFDPSGFLTEVLQGLHTQNNAFGHIALSINGKVCSFGTNYSERGKYLKDWGVSKETYFETKINDPNSEYHGKSQNEIRETIVTEIKVKPEQEAQLVAHLEANNPNSKGSPKYNETANSCVTQTETALIEGSVLPETSPRPVFSGQDIKMLETSNSNHLTPGGLVATVENEGLVENKSSVGKEVVPQKTAIKNTIKKIIERVFLRDDDQEE